MLRVGKLFGTAALSSNRYASTKLVPLIEEEYTKEPNYPPIEDLSFQSKLRKKRTQWHDHIKALETAEEKLYALNIPRYYGYKTLMLNDNTFTYNCLPLMQHCTRTALHVDGLPKNYENNQEKAAKFLTTIKSDIEDAILFEHSGYR